MLLNHEEAASAASSHLATCITAYDITALCSLGVIASFGRAQMVRLEEVKRTAAGVLVHRESASLFTDFHQLFSHDAGAVEPIEIPSIDGTVFLKLGRELAISMSVEKLRPDLLQLLLSMIRRRAASLMHGKAPNIQVLDLGGLVSVWSTNLLDASAFHRIWGTAVSADAVGDEAEVLTLPKIYGTKNRLSPFIAAVSRSYIEDNSAVLDVMSGTGVVSSRLSHYFKVFANDANPYASLLTEVRFLDISCLSIGDIKPSFDSDYKSNMRSLEALCAEALIRERKFLHADQTRELAEDYEKFCNSFPLSEGSLLSEVHVRVQNTKKSPFCLVTAYFSNAYFGVHQSAQIDSIRFAIEHVSDHRMKKLLLAALLIVCTMSGSGPHFAQPPKLTGPIAMREIIEHRARDIYAEFLIIAEILLSTKRSPERFLGARTGDWRLAISEFINATPEYTGKRLIYVDPPYSKLQFSRYYHVLNTLIAYDYPGFSGQGRYPPRNTRFSSKFEYQPGPAEKEFVELFRAVAAEGIVAIVSYSDTGFVSPTRIVALMEQSFPVVHVYSKAFRHHSQGKRFKPGRQNVAEYLFVGTFT